jgi:hypothetical protein
VEGLCEEHYAPKNGIVAIERTSRNRNEVVENAVALMACKQMPMQTGDVSRGLAANAYFANLVIERLAWEEGTFEDMIILVLTIMPTEGFNLDLVMRNRLK